MGGPTRALRAGGGDLAASCEQQAEQKGRSLLPSASRFRQKTGLASSPWQARAWRVAQGLTACRWRPVMFGAS